MFFLKKAFSSFLLPFPIFLILLGLSLFFWKKGSIRKAKSFFFVSLLWISLLSYTPFSSLLLFPLERTYPKIDSSHISIRYIHVLGSGHITNPTIPLESEIEPPSLIRDIEGITLYKQNPGIKLIFSGYAKNDPVSNARKNAQLAIALGVNPADIILLETPKDTYEEAIAVKKIIGITPVILVTSASHMPRANALFHKAGINTIPAPTDFLVKKEEDLFQLPSAGGLMRSERAFHEYLGLVWGRLSGIL
ncbi:MAG: ElyC/SanA/YdcF family protein [Sulfuricurvum sp.]|uniref:ElyC/SanA/YdcF family protein n=1 Tax=Sulfuricurvum sp. TaxID=2025608 RepID=UPI00260F53F2|nr:ElyC/SanA/YdcF family protein [Sulfuricurvum sp.]MDD2367782.1 ElyC/SanA/YdcF family protein [Sulfuricurvum sp.]MDD2949800.1 ElyC/SanA/YdcF family protein [Sulfuricurvum sp.]MDD5118405.1 ElyC/SanA/YdcF family protein [Sulfuricurvum sp.]